MPLSDATRRRIDSFVSDWVSAADVPGAGLAVVDPDGIQYATGYGARDLEAGDPATTDRPPPAREQRASGGCCRGCRCCRGCCGGPGGLNGRPAEGFRNVGVAVGGKPVSPA
ncbi:hypothetical protein [Haloparvum sp. PAK95]|uniref:hypothetical protein n=1 Tax=Haloparvum sp. PAK95 TaxID=3418962 RepID=UPI003D2ED4E1